MDNELDKAVLKEVQSIQKQSEEWQEVCGHIKTLITEWDHTKTEPIKLVADINNFLDHAFQYMPIALAEIKEYSKR